MTPQTPTDAAYENAAAYLRAGYPGLAAQTLAAHFGVPFDHPAVGR